MKQMMGAWKLICIVAMLYIIWAWQKGKKVPTTLHSQIDGPN